MKALLMTVCIGVATGAVTTAQESEVEESTNKSAAELARPTKEENKDLISSAEVLSSFEKSGVTLDQAFYSQGSFPSLNLDTNAAVEKVSTNDLTKIDLQRVQITGTLTPVVRKRTFGSFLQLFNPFAPAEYGGTVEPSGKTPSRAFMDPVTTQPTSPLIAVGAQPKKAEE